MAYEIVDLAGHHQRQNFCCGRSDVIDRFFRDEALDHHQRNATRVKVALSGGDVVGFYTLAATSLAKERKLPLLLGGRNHICPAFHLQMVAICQNQARNELGPALIRHAFETASRASDEVGAMCIYIEAGCEDLVPYYVGYGFDRVSSRQLAMYAPMSVVKDAIRPA